MSFTDFSCLIEHLCTSAGTAQGEIVAYQNAALTDTGKYTLTYLVRGCYGTEANIASWPAGTSFARLDGGVVALPYDASRVGAVIYIKLASFNSYGAATQQLSSINYYSYPIQGYALSSPLPNVQNFRSS